MVNLNRRCLPISSTGSLVPILVFRRPRLPGDPPQSVRPRPAVLGAFGRFGRGDRPWIFSTKLEKPTSGGKKWDLHQQAPDAQVRLTYQAANERE